MIKACRVCQGVRVSSVVGVGALAFAVRLGFGFLINVLFHCILTAVGHYADSRCHGLVVNTAKPLFFFCCFFFFTSDAAAESSTAQEIDRLIIAPIA